MGFDLAKSTHPSPVHSDCPMVQQLLCGSRKLLAHPFGRTVRAKQAMQRTCCSMLAGPDVPLSPAQHGIKAKKKVALHLGKTQSAAASNACSFSW